MVVGTKEELLEKEFLVKGLNWVAVEGLKEETQAEVKIRYTHPAAPATLYPEGQDTVRVVLHVPQNAVTPGQAAVFYERDVVLGGGWIEETVVKETSVSKGVLQYTPTRENGG